MAKLAGDDDQPAVAGFDPDVSAELYTTNGDVTDDTYKAFDTLAYTVELDGGTGPAVGGTDGTDPAYTPNGFAFQDSEADIQAQFEKNLAFALDLARSAKDPAQLQLAPGQHGAGAGADDVPGLLRRSADRRGQRQARARLRDRALDRSTAAASTRASTREFKGGSQVRRSRRLLPPPAR